MMESLVNKLSGILNRLFGGEKLVPYESLVIEAWKSTLEASTRDVLDAQLAAVSQVQHQAGGAKVCFYYRDGAPLFRNTSPDLHAGTVYLQSDNRSKLLPVKIMVHRGAFFSIEFPKRPERYFELHQMQADALRVAKIEVNASLDSAA